MSDAPRLSNDKSNAPMIGQRPWVDMETDLIKQCLIGFLEHDRHYLAQQLQKYDLKPRFLFPTANQMYKQRVEQARAVLHDTEGFAKEFKRRGNLVEADRDLLDDVTMELAHMRRRFSDLR